MELIAKLSQTALAEYNTEFERMRGQIKGVPESILLPIYLGGLRNPVLSQVRFQHPSSVAAAMAFATEFDASLDRSSSVSYRPWQPRESRPAASSVAPSPIVDSSPDTQPSSRSRDYLKLPIVRLSSAEKAEKTRLGLCWYCSDKWAKGHVCKGKFLAYMGSDDEEADDDRKETSPPSTEVVSADLSHIYRMDGQPRAASLEFHGFLGASEVFILVDTGSTHNFVHPSIVEKVKLPLTSIRPFRVYVGNGHSLICSYMCARAELRIQGHSSLLDLYVLPVYGQDVILGMSWLRSLHRVTSDYDAGTVEFMCKGRPVCLKVTQRKPRQISVHTLASILIHQEEVDCFEIVAAPERS